MNSKVVLFLILELFIDSKISWNKSFFLTYVDSSLGHHVNAKSRKGLLEIQAHSITKPRSENLYEN